MSDFTSITTAHAKRAFVSRKALIAVGLAVAVAVAGIVYIASPAGSVATDDAYLQADSSTIAPKVRGLVAAVMVDHNQVVRQGDPLVRIDDEEFAARVAAAQADLLNAQAAVASARAALIALTAEEKLAQSQVRAAETTIRSSDAQRERANADHERYESLTRTGAVSRHELDSLRAQAISAQADADRSRAEYDVSRDRSAVIYAKRQTFLAALAQSQATVARADAALTLAKQDLAHTTLFAPIDGVVGDRQVEQGDYVQPGSRILTIVPLHAVYVVANFKETQTGRMRVEQPAEIKVDALPGVTLTGRVTSFAPGSGSQFSLLPFEPGTGNFTKIVQRIPVRIRFDAGQAALARLRPGLSTTVTVRLVDADKVERVASLKRNEPR
jgi:membrane fusion protein (multidrug efflux system)